MPISGQLYILYRAGSTETNMSTALPLDPATLQALCAYANCTIVEGTNPPVAECGCQVSSTTLQPNAYSVGTATTILDKNLQSITENVSVKQFKSCGSLPQDMPCPEDLQVLQNARTMNTASRVGCLLHFRQSRFERSWLKDRSLRHVLLLLLLLLQRCGSIGLQNSVCSNPPNQAPFCPVSALTLYSSLTRK
jgi:hypothetical protein